MNKQMESLDGERIAVMSFAFFDLVICSFTHHSDNKWLVQMTIFFLTVYHILY